MLRNERRGSNPLFGTKITKKDKIRALRLLLSHFDEVGGLIVPWYLGLDNHKSQTIIEQ